MITSDFYKQKPIHVEATQQMQKDSDFKDWLVNDMPHEIPPLTDIDVVSKKRSTVQTMLTELTTEIPTVQSVSDSERY